MKEVVLKLRREMPSVNRDRAWRDSQLRRLRDLLRENEEAIARAVFADLRKSEFETMTSEVAAVISEIDEALQNLRNWMAPRPVQNPLWNQPGRCEIHANPRGLVLIIGAWNYPVNLVLSPLVAALAGGNAVVLKPSELAPKTAEVLTQLIPRYLDERVVAVVNGAAEETSRLLEEKFDLIFFTGSTQVGRIIMAKAALHLTPVTLELGGKSPAVVLADADLKVAAKRIAWGKMMNAGQTCVAPDYVLVESSVKDRFAAELVSALKKMYGDDPSRSADYGRIVNGRHHRRLVGLLSGSRVIHGGQFSEADLYFAPTVLETTWDAPVMQDEIFGPLLPILEIAGPQEAIEKINERPSPLALYLFTANENVQDQFAEQTKSGALGVNEVVLHMTVHGLPFGGVGASGMGHYHGRFGFETMTHAKSVLRRPFWGDLPLRYPPYSDTALRWIRRFLEGRW